MKVLLAFLVNTITNFFIGLVVAKFLGPEEYGRFALAFAIAVVVQTALYDWLRLSATRFYSERTRDSAPAVRATMDASFLGVTLFLFLSTGLYALIGPELDFESDLILLALLTATANGLFDYSTALARARFHDHAYGRLLFVKNALALVLIGGGAFLFHSASVALAGGVASLFGTVLFTRAALRDPGAPFRAAELQTTKWLVAYSAPIVAAHLLYQAMPLASRSIVASVYDFAETGQFSLAYDLGMRAVMAFGSALDVLLFQIAVAAHEEHGEDRAKEQVARNMSVVFVFLLPACVGLWLVMPSVEALIVPGQFRGPFGHYLGLLLPGLFAMGFMSFGINPVFQIEKRTAPLIVAAVAAVVVSLALLFVLPWGRDASNLAIAQAGGYLAALAVTIYYALRAQPVWPSFWDVFAALVATGVMYLALAPMRAFEPGFFTMLLQIGTGAAIYGVMVVIFDIAGLRSIALALLRPLIARA
ncbi:lipopolysaccharide biosynthesis protein [Methylocystis sp. WRRC1]|uniref:lipopolysaccharide biosynthesis protein n=1 Tax=Methylocystis sp. WRRC1 TaxID=1732014 RepID=UPI001D148A43|nr:lipopolysaccharide biosynthesis protein [Methylocystis sp. WRRC1]